MDVSTRRIHRRLVLFWDYFYHLDIFSNYKNFLIRQEDWEKLIEISRGYEKSNKGNTNAKLALAEILLYVSEKDMVYTELENEGYEIDGEVGLIPINMVKISGIDAKQLLGLLEKLEEHEDIQKVYSNFDLDESDMASFL